MTKDFHAMEMRFVYGETLNELIDADPRVMCLEADLSKASGTNPDSLAASANFLNVGVAEANMISLAAGLASEGKVPFSPASVASPSRRAYDQITISVAYANMNVKIVGTSPGVTAGANGGTHMCFQDLAIMRAMPNMHVYCPCDAMELRWCSAAWPPPASRPTCNWSATRWPGSSTRNTRFDPRQAVLLREGRDVTLVSTGYMTQFALPAADELAARGCRSSCCTIPRSSRWTRRPWSRRPARPAPW